MHQSGSIIGKVARVTAAVAPKAIGEVMVAVRGGTEAFLAYGDPSDAVFAAGERVVVIEYHPPRTVVVARA